MLFNPLTQFMRSLINGDRFRFRRVRVPAGERRRRLTTVGTGVVVASPAELLEQRAMLSSPQLVVVSPNTGGIMTNGVVETEAPKELTFTFSPGQNIDPTSLAAGITITRSGGDGVFGAAGTIADQIVAQGFAGVAVAGNTNNQVTIRFNDTLPDDTYRITLTGAKAGFPNGLKNVGGDGFVNGASNVQTLDFKVDYGSQVISLVPQPVLRTENLNVLDFSKITDLDKFTITTSGTPVTFQFKNTTTNSVVGAGNVAINFTPGTDTAATLAVKTANAINTFYGAGGKVAATANGTSVALAGSAFTPAVRITAAQGGFLSLTDGALVQKNDTIVAYFNQNQLNPTLAADPGYYQVINSVNGSILLPSSVQYDTVTNSAVLKFSTNIPTGTFQLKIGAPNLAQNTLATAVVAGTLFGDTGGYSTNGYLGNVNHTSNGGNDVDLYQFNVLAGGPTQVNISATQLDANLGGSVVLRLFDFQGNAIGAPTNNAISTSLIPGTYYVGVSATGNTNYNVVNGSGAVVGAGFGSYKLGIAVGNTLASVLNNDTTSFGTSTDLGTLGAAGQTISDNIAPLGNLSYPTLPGGPDEPGHRDINVPGENNAGQPLSTNVPGSIPIFYYNFQDVYGVDPQSNTLHNAITSEQRDLARQIFDIYGSYLGIEFVETANLGLTVATGDIRAVSPAFPPDAVGGVYGTRTDGLGVDSIINASAVPGGASQYGGTWFNIAFHEIGHALGLEHSYDAPSVMGQGVGGNSGVEAVYPGDINLVPAENLNAPDSTDINIYKFQVTQGGTFSAQTIAQRLTTNGAATPSLLDSVLTLYQESYIAAQATSDFGTNGAALVKFIAKPQGTAGNAVSIVIQKGPLGAGNPPSISVVGNQITVTLNTSGTQTTAQQLIDAINNNAQASALVSASLASGISSTNITAPNLANSTVQLAGGQTNRTVVARNDDYFGTDSFVNLHLDSGIYFLAVSSTGNTSFDPSVPDTGFGGRTDGIYQLKMNFTPDPASTTTLNDAGGIALDGDGDAAAGGTFNFWFNSNTTANTIFVDKANSADVTQTGSIAHPYSTIAAALAAATPGKIVRIVGNGGTDGDPSTLTDDKAYLIGFDTQGNPVADGADFKVPKGVTVMIDAGAILKLRGAVIDVGDSVNNIDRSGGALQVLGTPTQNVYFTSLRDTTKGGNTDPTSIQPAAPGNWGGIRFQQASDVQGLDFQGNGIFLNSVNQANIAYGGGQVTQDSVPQVFDPIHISNPDGSGATSFFARPAIWNNTITLSADAAISADPNSFFNSLDRVGPDIHGNKVLNNTINGLFIRIRTQLGEAIDKLQVPARFDDTDITYVLTENLLIQGAPGGPLAPAGIGGGSIQNRLAGGLVIDPGVILKISGARIEAQVGGSQLIAEGSDAHPIIFTSLRDDTYGGGGGTFDTGADGKTSGAAGDWGGLFFNATSNASIDKARITFAGGITPIAGGFAHFNPVEIQQADVRITNTLFQNNAGGDSSVDADPNRNGLMGNGSATIFVRGAQPVIVDNTFVNNAGDIISINANALNSLQVADWGRSTGAIDAFSQFVNNSGPLVRLNQFTGNGTNGMNIRPETITTETVWDDTDIVHVLRGLITDDINLHTYDGIRLESSPDQSLVVKLLGANAGFEINGTPLDISDRIGGTLQILGTPNHPVVLTSLNDDTVGAGFRPDGQPQLDTNGNGSATTPSAGDWNSVSLDQYSNDRNVAVAIESEQIANQQNTNGNPQNAEFLGNLAPDTFTTLSGVTGPVPTDTPEEHKGGNDDQPLGFEVHGFLNKPTDADVYSFNASAGTEVWFDISRTSSSLNTILELVDANGAVLASSDDSQFGTRPPGDAPGLEILPYMKDPLLGGDFYTTNPRDAGMRVVLPGTFGQTGTYFIRVASLNGQTQGEYTLQVRLQQVYEHPGSTIRYSDIRYATTGIEIHGLPDHSPLGGTSTSAGGNVDFNSAQSLGNLLASDQNTINVSGSLATSTQVDWYKFNVDFDLIQSLGGVNAAAKTWATIFDIDYADGLARPDLTMSVFDQNGNLILISRNSDVTNDQPAANNGNDLDNLSAGSVGKLDPFIGTVMLPAGMSPTTGGPEDGNAGIPADGTRTYYVAISSNRTLPQALDATFTANASNSLIRLEPIDSVKRIVEDHIGVADAGTFGTPGYTSGSVGLGVTTKITPTTGPILPIATVAQLQAEVRPFTLSDVPLFINTFPVNNLNQIATSNGFDGASEFTVGTVNNGLPGAAAKLQFRDDGTFWMYEPVTPATITNVAGQIMQIDPGTGQVITVLGSDNIPDIPMGGITNTNQLTTEQVDSFAWGRPGFLGQTYSLYYAIGDTTGIYNNGRPASRLYLADTTSGSAAAVPGQPWGVRGEIQAPGFDIGFTTGMVWLGNTLYGVTSNGFFISINVGSGQASVIKQFPAGTNFSGLTLGPQNAYQAGNLGNATPAFYANMLFAITSNGTLMALNTAGTAQPIFNGGAQSMATGRANATALAFSPVDFNLWHPTTQRNNDPGHGMNGAFDNSRGGSNGISTTLFNINGRTTTEFDGGTSYYFGLEDFIQPGQANLPSAQNYTIYNGIDAQYGIQTQQYMQRLLSNTAASGLGDNYNAPGGAYGSLITGSFSLTTYSATDLPTLYFNYFLDTQNASGSTASRAMQDDARVFASTDGGVTWTMLATNNSQRSNPAVSAELPQYLTAEQNDAVLANPVASQPFGQQVQELYDSASWRQARVDLSRFVGQSNIQLRFDFSTSGTSMLGGHNEGLQGDSSGRGETSNQRGIDNAHEGFYIDDIMVGLAGRGEMVTGSVAGQTTAFFTAAPGLENDTNYTQKQLTGAYQLEIRRGTEYTIPVVNSNGTDYRSTITPNFPNIALDPNQLDINTILAPGWSMQVPTGTSLADGQTFTISDGVKQVTFELDNDNVVAPGNRRVAFSFSDNNVTVARSIRDAINGANAAGLFNVTAALGDGLIVGANTTNARVDIFGATNVTNLTTAGDIRVSINQTSIAENGGSATGTVTIPQALGANLTVSLTVINPATGLPATDVSVPATVTIIAGQTSVTFPINGTNDAIAQGTRTVLIKPTAVGFASTLAPIDVTDEDVAALTLTINNPSRSEGQAGTATVTRNSSTLLALPVIISSLNPREVTVPDVPVIIPAGQTSVTFPFTANTDSVADGNRPVTIVASAPGFTIGSGVVTVVDNGNNSAPTAIFVNGAVDISQRTGNQVQGSIAIDHTNPNRLFAISLGATATGLVGSVSTDNGQSWFTRGVADGAGDGLPLAGGDQSVVADDAGNLFLVYRNATSDTIVVAISTDFGFSFSLLKTFTITPPPTGTVPDQPSIAVGNGSVWVSLHDTTTGGILVSGAHVTGLGAVGAFTTPQLVPQSATWQFGDIAVGPNGEVMVAYQTNVSPQGPTSIFTSINTDPFGVGTFSAAPVLVTATNVGIADMIPAQNRRGIDAEVGLAWDRTGGVHNGRVYMVYTNESPDESNDTDIFLRASDDNGATWTALGANPIRVNSPSSNSQFLPHISIDPTTGNIAVVWYDTKNDTGMGSSGDTNSTPNDEAQFWGAFGFYVSGNFTLSANIKLSPSNTSALNAGNGQIDFGGYSGADFYQGQLFPIWADNSALLPNPNLPSFDMATAKVTLGGQAFSGLATLEIDQTSVTEVGGSSQARIKLTDLTGAPLVVKGQPITVQLAANIAGLANFPTSVTIQVGQSQSSDFTITGINNNIATGSQTLVISPTAAFFEGVGDAIQFTDEANEKPTLTVTSAGGLFEGQTITGTVSRNTPTDVDLLVFLSSTDTSELTVPATVLIRAGQTSATFTITAVQDLQVDGTRLASIIASVTGMISGRRNNIQVFDSQVTNVQTYKLLGDRNVPKQQGALEISNNTISHVLNSGIVLTSGPRDGDLNANLPHMGSPINGPTLNSARLLPGPQISNNVIYDFGDTGAGIQFSGDADPAGQAVAGVPYGRIINNTIFGGLSAKGTGILVTNNAAPTILNNIISNTATGITIDASSTSQTQVGTELFKGNLSNGVVGTNAITLGALQPLFVNPATGNFYLAKGTPANPNLAIDSSLNTLAENTSMVAVKSPLNIPTSPINAPTLDRFGQLRVDDPNTANASGLGQNIFKDRGAIERADFAGPTARLFVPLDNQPGIDGDPSVGNVFIITPAPLTQIVVELQDTGIGIDNSTVSSSDFVLKQNGVTLVDGVDYVFVYNANTHQATFQSASVFPSDSNYTVSVNAPDILDLAANPLQGNQADGSLLLTITGNAAPSISPVAPLPGLKNIPRDITFSELQTAANLQVVAAHASSAAFRIESVQNGTLKIQKSGDINFVDVVPGVTIFQSGDLLRWTIAPNTTGVIPAFTVSGYDTANAVIAPALSVSPTSQAVSINLVNQAPALTTNNNLVPHASEDTPLNIAYSDLVTAFNPTDANNDSPISFKITAVTSGTLKIQVGGVGPFVAVAANQLVTSTDVLQWTPPLNGNSDLSGGPFNAFQVVGTDGQADSATPGQAKIFVDAVPDAPILTTMAGFGLGGFNAPFRITYADLVANGNEQNVDGHVIQFQITSITPGSTLQIQLSGSNVKTTASVGQIVSAGDQLFWTPPLNTFGLNQPAFKVVAYDDFNHTHFAPGTDVSSPPVQVTVNVSSNSIPTLDSFNAIVEPRFVPVTVTFAQLATAANNFGVVSGHTAAFRLDSITSGSLQISVAGGAFVNVAPGQLISSGDVLRWTSIAGATGVTPAFKLFAVDTTSNLNSTDSAQVSFDLQNVTPTLTSINTLQQTLQETAFNIPFDTFKNATNAADANNDAISFRIESVVSGDLRIIKSGTNTPVGVQQGVTIFSSGDTLVWTPSSGVFGDSIGAFSVRAYDGLVTSSSAVQANVKVNAFGSRFDLTGTWVVNGQIARIQRNNSDPAQINALTISDQNGTGSVGAYTGVNTISGRNGHTGTLDLAAADQGRILWDDGVVWLRLSLGGQYYNPSNNNLVSVIQNGVQLTFVNASGGTSMGAVQSATTMSVVDWGLSATFADGKLKFFSGGNQQSQWNKLDLSPTYTNATGDAVGVLQNGTTTLTFVNKVGQTTTGNWTDPTHVTAPGWGVSGQVINGQIKWSNNTVWNKALVVNGASSGSGNVSVTATNNSVILTNKAGQTAVARITGPNTIVAVGWGGVTGTWQNNKITWNNGTVWDTFDYNSLDALFSDIKNFPFG